MGGHKQPLGGHGPRSNGTGSPFKLVGKIKLKRRGPPGSISLLNTVVREDPKTNWRNNGLVCDIFIIGNILIGGHFIAVHDIEYF